MVAVAVQFDAATSSGRRRASSGIDEGTADGIHLDGITWKRVLHRIEHESDALTLGSKELR